MTKKKKEYVFAKEHKRLGLEEGDTYSDQLGTDYEDLIAKGIIREEVDEKPEPKKRAKKVEVLTPLPAEEREPVRAIVQTVPEGEVVVPKEFKTKLTRQQIEVIKEQFAKGASDTELQVFLYTCARTGLDPFSRQIHLVPRWDSRLRKEVRTVVVGIDGFRSVAERTGNYAGNTDPVFEGDKEISFSVGDKGSSKMTVPAKATVTVKKAVAGVIAEFTASAKWDEYYPGDKGGMMWRKMPENMLGKCAEAKALRKAFPNVMSGLYVPEEVHQAVAAPGDTGGALETDFQKAERMIKATKNADGLEEMKGKVKESKKYKEGEKETLLFLMDQRIDEIRKDGVDAPSADDAAVV